MGDDNRHEMMESLFGAESGDSDDEPEPEPKPSDSNNSNSANSGRDDEEGEGEGGGDVEVESDMDGGESERAVSENGREVESEAEREASDREVASDREALSDREVEEAEPSMSGSETSHHDGRGVDYDENEVEEVREPSEQGDDEQGENEQVDDEPVDDEQVEEDPVDEEQADDEQQVSAGVAEARDVFGDSDDDDQEVERRRSRSRERSLAASIERGGHSEDERSEQEAGHDMDDRSESEEERHTEPKREKPVGAPLDLEVPLRPPPGRSDQLNLVRISNIMGIESKPFDPKTYVEESTFVTDAEGKKQRLRLEENIARWRVVRARDGSESFESNARFVKWSDGSMQLLLGGEVLDLSVQDSRHDQSHLFIRHPKSLLQSQGRLLRKMKFMPSSLTSKSHKLLTALVDSRHKKVLKVRSIVTNIDPDKEKEGQEKAVEQRIRSRSDLQRKQDKIQRKYSHMPSRGDREAQLSPGYLEGALEEEEEAEDYGRGSRRHMDSRRFHQQLEDETRAERRILNAKRQGAPARRPQTKDRRPAPSRREMLEDTSEEEREESAYETDLEDEEEILEDVEKEYDDEDEEEEDDRRWSDKGKAPEREERRGRHDREDDDRKRRRDRSEERELSPPKKSTQRRRVVVSDSEEDD